MLSKLTFLLKEENPLLETREARLDNLRFIKFIIKFKPFSLKS